MGIWSSITKITYLVMVATRICPGSVHPIVVAGGPHRSLDLYEVTMAGMHSRDDDVSP